MKPKLAARERVGYSGKRKRLRRVRIFMRSLKFRKNVMGGKWVVLKGSVVLSNLL